MVRCGFKNGHQMNMSLHEIELYAHSFSRLNIQHNFGSMYDHSIRKRILHFGNLD